MKKEYISNSPQETKNIAEKMDIFPFIGLEGDLGGGKTTFLQGLGEKLKVKERILSPTFIIMRKIEISHHFFENFYHIDCYRLKKSKEILQLGFDQIIKNPKNIIAVEWVSKIKDVLPEKIVLVEFDFISENKRKIKISKKFKNDI